MPFTFCLFPEKIKNFLCFVCCNLWVFWFDDVDLYLGGVGQEEMEGEDESKAEFLCPFCAEDYDVVGLCCHIDEDHPIEAKNGVPFCLFFNKVSFFMCVFA